MGYIRILECAKIISLTSAATLATPLQDFPSPPPLLLLLDVPCPDLKSLFLCHLAHVHQEDSSSFTRKSTSPPRSCLPSATFDFHSEVTSPVKNLLANALLTLTRKSTSPPRSCLPSVTSDFHSEVTSPLKNMLANALLTFTQKSLHLSRTCLQVHL